MLSADDLEVGGEVGPHCLEELDQWNQAEWFRHHHQRLQSSR